MNKLIAVLIPIIVLLSACADKYKPYMSRYKFKSSDGAPDYSNLDYWAAHPWKEDPSDSIPSPLQNEFRDSIVDVFFLHPTTFTKKKYSKEINATIDDSYLSAKTDFSTILYQATAFNQHARIFAPRYRQVHLKVFLMKDKEKAGKGFDLAYQDIRNAFLYYLNNWNKGRPIIIAAHSQGSFMAERLLKDLFENKPLQKQLVAAYVAGWPVPKEYFTSLKMCADSSQTGCICSWRTLQKGFIPWYLKNEKGNSYVTNPLSWITTEEYASRNLNKGSVLTNFNKVYPHTTDARVVNGLLWVKKPRFPGSFFYLSRNYHIGDINLYYLNIRENVEQRINAFFRTKRK